MVCTQFNIRKNLWLLYDKTLSSQLMQIYTNYKVIIQKKRKFIFILHSEDFIYMYM